MTRLLAVTGLTGLDEWLAESVATGTFTNRSQLDCLCDQHIPKTRLAEHRATARFSTAAYPADMGARVDLVAKSTEASSVSWPPGRVQHAEKGLPFPDGWEAILVSDPTTQEPIDA